MQQKAKERIKIANEIFNDAKYQNDYCVNVECNEVLHIPAIHK